MARSHVTTTTKSQVSATTKSQPSGVRRGLAMNDFAIALSEGQSVVRAPFGYARATICVEPPKRQRTNTTHVGTPASLAAMPVAKVAV